MTRLVDVETRIRQALDKGLPGAAAQRRFAPTPERPGWSPTDRPLSARRAAALVVLFPEVGTGRPAIPLTVRRPDLPHHPGQVSLPGGALNAGESPADAALRETEEEIGLPAGHVRIIGALSSLWVPVSNYVIEPFIGVVDEPPPFQAHPGEVHALVEVPLADLIDESRVRWDERQRDGVRVRYRYFDVGGQMVWGATAMVLGEFVAVLNRASNVGL